MSPWQAIGRHLTRRQPRPLPRVEIDLGRTVPGWLLRAAAALLTGGTPLLAAPLDRGLQGWTAVLVIAALLAAATVRWPGHVPALTGIAVVTALLLFHADDDGLLRALWLAPLGYLGLRLNLWAAATWPRARVELQALARSARHDLAVVATTILVGAVATLFTGGNSVAALGVGAVGLLVLALVALRSDAEGADDGAA